jgi:hypothetical protein
MRGLTIAGSSCQRTLWCGQSADVRRSYAGPHEVGREHFVAYSVISGSQGPHVSWTWRPSSQPIDAGRCDDTHAVRSREARLQSSADGGVKQDPSGENMASSLHGIAATYALSDWQQGMMSLPGTMSSEHVCATCERARSNGVGSSITARPPQVTSPMANDVTMCVDACTGMEARTRS